MNDVNQILFEMSGSRSGRAKELVFESQDLEFTNEELNLIHEMYSSAGIMGMGSAIPAERSPEEHERYVRMRHDMQGLKTLNKTDILQKTKKKSQKLK